MNTKRSVPWVFWPFYAIAQLVAAILKLTGRFAAALLGFILLVVGGVLSITIIGAVIGLPMMLVGVLLIVKAIF